MPVTIVLGGQWGDEGKGKIIDALASSADIVIRANGGANAGHTVVNDDGIFKFHLIPSGILHPNCMCVVGAGVILDPAMVVQEIETLRKSGINPSNLRISSRAHVIMPYHPALDQLQEDRLGEDKIGTTQRGMGPAYADKASRTGIRVADIADPEFLFQRLSTVLEEKNNLLRTFYGHDGFDLNEVGERYAALGEALRPYITETEMLVQDAVQANREVLVEGAQAVMLDIDYGSYPFVTSSSPTAAGVCQGAGVAPTQIDRVIGVYKAYTTRVGEGAFPTELMDSTGDMIRERGAEFGTTTGRPRRTGWFDAVQARYTARLNGVQEIALTKFDILDQLESIKIAVGYQLDGKRLDAPPASIHAYQKVEPIYETHPGWMTDTTGMHSFHDLPPAAFAYIRRIEELIGIPVTFVGVGPHRKQLIDGKELRPTG
ncbi:MAG: adenylosuccinate synthase [Chloroflexota bacterium]